MSFQIVTSHKNSTIFIEEKKSTYKWTYAVQTRVLQGQPYIVCLHLSPAPNSEWKPLSTRRYLVVVDFFKQMCPVQAALLTEPHERQERDLVHSDRYISISVSPGVNYMSFSDSFLFPSLSPRKKKIMHQRSQPASSATSKRQQGEKNPPVQECLDRVSLCRKNGPGKRSDFRASPS